MDKGFNDDELADIMNEIESLEQEFTHEVEAKKEPVQAQTEPSVQDMDNVEDHPNDVEESDQNVETVVHSHYNDTPNISNYYTDIFQQFQYHQILQTFVFLYLTFVHNVILSILMFHLLIYVVLLILLQMILHQ